MVRPAERFRDIVWRFVVSELDGVLMGEPKRKSVQENNRTPQEEKTRTTLREWLTKNWQTLLTTIFSLIAVGFSIGSCVVSNRANQLSQQAIETSTEQFFVSVH